MRFRTRWMLLAGSLALAWGCGAQLKQPGAAAAQAAMTPSPTPAPRAAAATSLPAVGMAQSAPAAENGAYVMLQWVTSSEVLVAGYNVMRGESLAGPFKTANATLIPAAGTTQARQQYRFTDQGLEADRVYYYYVEEVLLSGTSRKLSPVKAFTAGL